MWMRWNDSTHIFEMSTNDGASWAVLPLNASVINEGSISVSRLPGNIAVKDANNFFTAAQSITGQLNINNGGFTLSSNTTVQMNVRCTLNSGNCEISLGNDVQGRLSIIQAFGSTFTLGGAYVPNGCTWTHLGAGGITLLCTDGAASIRFMTSSTERLKVTTGGEVQINASVANIGGGSGQLQIAADAAVHNGIVIQNINPTNNAMYYTLFYNSANGIAGTIVQTGVSTISYGTTSDARLKIDKGRVLNLSALRALIIHDFEWIADKVEDRGIFAQEAHEHFPRAIIPPSETFDIWMTDYSKFVPDLIAGWQEHDKEIAELKRMLNG